MTSSTSSLSDISATWDGYEFDFSLSKTGLAQLIGRFRNLIYGIVQLEMPTVPSGTFVRAMDIHHGDGKLKVSLVGDIVRLAGGEGAFSLLADNMVSLLDLWISGGDQHFHFDPSSDVLLLAPDSEAFILSPMKDGSLN